MKSASSRLRTRSLAYVIRSALWLLFVPFLSACLVESGGEVDSFFDSNSSSGSGDSTVGCGGIQKELRIVESGSGDQSTIGNITVEVTNSVTVKATLYDLRGNYIEDTEVWWTLTNPSFSSSDLSVTEAQSETGTFTPTSVGSTLIQASYDGDDSCVSSKTDTTGSILVTSNNLIGSLTLVAGDNQSATVNNVLATELTVIAKDTFNQPLVATQINFTVTGGDSAIVGSSSVTTGIDGTASTSVRVGCTAGTNNFRATSAANGALTVDFAATGTVGAPSLLVFTIDPGDTFATLAFGTQPVVAIKDVCGNTLTAQNGNVTLSVATGTGTLSGAVTQALSSGVATFFGLIYDTAEDVTLRATWSGSGSITGDSSSFTVLANPPGACLVNDGSMTTADGGCKDVATGLVWSAISPDTYTWHEAVWDSTVTGNSQVDAGDYGWTNDYATDIFDSALSSIYLYLGTCSGSCDASTTNYCHDLTQGSKSDWRLPTCYELDTVLNHMGDDADYYIQDWNSSTYVWSSNTAYNEEANAIVISGNGSVNTGTTKATSRNTICVRGDRSDADRLAIRGGASESVVRNSTNSFLIQIRDAEGNDARVEEVTITLSTDPGTLGGTTTATTNSNGMATVMDWYFIDSPSNPTLTFSASGYTPISQQVSVETSFEQECKVDADSFFSTADGGCKFLPLGIVYSTILLNQTWHETIWDSNLPGNTVPDADDNGATTDYENSPGSASDTSTVNYCHDKNESGKTDWRVPLYSDAFFQRNALLSALLYDFRQGNALISYLPDLPWATYYWAAKTYTSDESKAYALSGISPWGPTFTSKSVTTYEALCIRYPD